MPKNCLLDRFLQFFHKGERNFKAEGFFVFYCPLFAKILPQVINENNNRLLGVNLKYDFG